MSHLFRLSPLVALFALVISAGQSFGQAPNKLADVATTHAEIIPPNAPPGATVTYRITVTPKPDAWTYPIKPSTTQGSVTTIVPPATGDLIFVTEPKDPAGKVWEKKFDLDLGGEIEFSTAPVTWEIKAVVSPKVSSGAKLVKLDKFTSLAVCNKSGCVNSKLDGSDLPVADFFVGAGPPVEVDPQFKTAVEKALAPTAPPGPTRNGATPLGPPPQPASAPTSHNGPKEPKPIEQIEAQLNAILKGLDKSEVTDQRQEPSVGAFVLTAAIWGLISLVTPCVFPMIPITVSIFLKHAHGSFRERIKLAGVYCLTIIVVLGLSAFALLKFMAWLSVHPVTNVLLGALFVVLALSLFGMYELTLPNFMVQRLQTKQSKGGVTGTIFGALAFTVISFTCVAPFLGGFAGISAAGTADGSLIAIPRTREILGGLAFATAFAAPFFILAMVPGLLKALPKSGGWLDSVKVVMGFLELAAALKFFRTAELGVFSPAEYFTFDLVLAGWVGISLACGLYLLNAYRLPHDEEKPNIGVVRLMFALLFLGLTVYLFPGLFKGHDGKPQRPTGAVFAWVDAFLLPEPGRETGEMRWGTDLHDALARSREEKAKTGTARPVLVDFTGVTCTNCKYNENAVFPQPKVQELLGKFERVQLYTDWLPSNLYATDPGDRARKLEARANRQFKIDAFGTDQLPLYATLLPLPDGRVKVLGIYDEGKINQPDQFAAWLKAALEKAKK